MAFAASVAGDARSRGLPLPAGVGDASFGVGDAMVGVGDAVVGVGDAMVGVGDAMTVPGECARNTSLSARDCGAVLASLAASAISSARTYGKQGSACS